MQYFPLFNTAHVASRILLSQCEYKTRASGTCCLLTKDNLSGVITFPPLIFLAQGNGVSHILLLLKISLQFSQCHSLREYITRLVYLMTIKTISMIKTKQRKRKGKKKKKKWTNTTVLCERSNDCDDVTTPFAWSPSSWSVRCTHDVVKETTHRDFGMNAIAHYFLWCHRTTK